MSAPSPAIEHGRRRKAWLFATLAGFMLLSPALPQVFGVGKPWIRQWTMFSGVGRGIPKGSFVVVAANGTERVRMTPLEAAGLARYPVRAPVERFDRYVYATGDLARFAAPACRALAPGEALRFAGVIGGWHGFTAPVEIDVCGGRA